MHITGIQAAGAHEATRLSQAIVHRAVEAATVAVVGERHDVARAARVPEAREAERLRDRPGRRRGGRDRRRERPGDDPETGSLVDLQA